MRAGIQLGTMVCMTVFGCVAWATSWLLKQQRLGLLQQPHGSIMLRVLSSMYDHLVFMSLDGFVWG